MTTCLHTIQERLSLPLSAWDSLNDVCFSLQLEDDSRDYSLHALLALSHNIAQWFNALKAKKGTQDTRFSVLLFHDNSFYMAGALLAANVCGVRIILPASCQENYLLSLDVRVDCVLASEENFSSIQPLLKSTSELSAIKNIASFLTPSTSLLNVSEPLKQQGDIVLFTSGSTSKPVAIIKTWQHLFDEVQLLEQSFTGHFDEAALFYATVSHQHIYGLLFRLLWPLLSARPFQDLVMPYPESLIGHVSDGAKDAANDSLVLVSSPAQLTRWLDHEDFSVLASKTSAIFSSGGPLANEAAITLSRRFKRAAIEVYGSTETGGIAWRQKQPGNQYSAVWRLFSGIQLKLQANGCLSIQSPLVPDYLCEADGYYLTQDKVVLPPDESRQLFELMGRADRVIKLEEKRLSLDDVERVLMSSSWVAQARALVIKQTGKRDTLSVVVVLNGSGFDYLNTQGKQQLVKQLKQLALKSFERVLLPRKWRFVDALPVNTQSKTTQLMLEALFEDKNKNTASINMQALPSLMERSQPFAQQYIKEQSDNTIISCIHLPLEDDVFTSHFSQIALLPGVVQLEWVMQLAQHWFEKTAFVGLQRFKFKGPMLPGQSVQLKLSCQHKRKEKQLLGLEKMTYTVTFEYRKMSSFSQQAELLTVFSSGQLLFDAQLVDEVCSSDK